MIYPADSAIQLLNNWGQDPVVQKLDNAIHRINLYPVDNAIGFPNTYPLDSDLSWRWIALSSFWTTEARWSAYLPPPVVIMILHICCICICYFVHSFLSSNADEELIVTLFCCFVELRRLEKIMLMHWKSSVCFTSQFRVEKAENSNILLLNHNCFRKLVSRVQIFMTSKNLDFDQQKLLLCLIFFHEKGKWIAIKKLNSILRRYYGFIMTASWEKIYFVLGSVDSQLRPIPNIFSLN